MWVLLQMQTCGFTDWGGCWWGSNFTKLKVWRHPALLQGSTSARNAPNSKRNSSGAFGDRATESGLKARCRLRHVLRGLVVPCFLAFQPFPPCILSPVESTMSVIGPSERRGRCPIFNSELLRENVETSGTGRFKFIGYAIDRMKPCVCLNASRNRARNVRQISIARSEYRG